MRRAQFVPATLQPNRLDTDKSDLSGCGAAHQELVLTSLQRRFVKTDQAGPVLLVSSGGRSCKSLDVRSNAGPDRAATSAVGRNKVHDLDLSISIRANS